MFKLVFQAFLTHKHNEMCTMETDRKLSRIELNYFWLGSTSLIRTHKMLCLLTKIILIILKFKLVFTEGKFILDSLCLLKPVIALLSCLEMITTILSLAANDYMSENCDL